jgi:hypothetical protein
VNLETVTLLITRKSNGITLLEITYQNGMIKGLIFKGEDHEFIDLACKILHHEQVRLFYPWQRDSLNNWGAKLTVS